MSISKYAFLGLLAALSSCAQHSELPKPWIDQNVRLYTKIVHGQCAGVAEQSWMIYNDTVNKYKVFYKKDDQVKSVVLGPRATPAWVGCALDNYTYKLISTDPI